MFSWTAKYAFVEESLFKLKSKINVEYAEVLFGSDANDRVAEWREGNGRARSR